MQHQLSRFSRLGSFATLMAMRRASSAWVHAHLHRVEGDLSNAHYWYRQAGRPAASGALDAERATIIPALL
jgi:hypothetical protein